MKINWKTFGDIGEAIVIAEAIKKGYTVSIPFGDNKKYDLIIERNGKLEKIQVKYHSGNGIFIRVDCCYNKGYKPKKYTGKDIDAIIVYDAYTKKCYYISSEYFIEGRNGIELRLVPTKNNQEKRVNWAKDFENW